MKENTGYYQCSLVGLENSCASNQVTSLSQTVLITTICTNMFNHVETSRNRKTSIAFYASIIEKLIDSLGKQSKQTLSY